MSDGDSRFTTKFWPTLFKLLGTQLLRSSGFHPETDGQTERVNTILESYLRHYVQADQKNWLELLHAAQFSYNMLVSSSTAYSQFELARGQKPLTPQVVATGEVGPSPAAVEFMVAWNDGLKMAKAHLEGVAVRAKKLADRKHRHEDF